MKWGARLFVAATAFGLAASDLQSLSPNDELAEAERHLSTVYKYVSQQLSPAVKKRLDEQQVQWEEKRSAAAEKQNSSNSKNQVWRKMTEARSAAIFAWKATAVRNRRGVLPVLPDRIPEFEDIKAATGRGEAYAQALAAIHYSLGWKTERNAGLALRYATISASKGHALGLFVRGALLRSGLGGTRDEGLGLQLQSRALKGLDAMVGDRWARTRQSDSFGKLKEMMGNPYALNALGLILEEGVVAPLSKTKASELYKLAADLGYTPAAFNYAMCAAEGSGMVRDPVARDKYLWRAIMDEYPPALKYIGFSDPVVTTNLSFELPQEHSKATDTIAPVPVGEVRTMLQQAPPTASARAVAINSRNNLLAIASEKIRVYELPSGRLVNSFEYPFEYSSDYGTGLTIFFVKDELALCVWQPTHHAGSDLHFVDAFSGLQSRAVHNLHESVSAIAFSEVTSKLLLEKHPGDHDPQARLQPGFHLYDLVSKSSKHLETPFSYRSDDTSHMGAMFNRDGNIVILRAEERVSGQDSKRVWRWFKEFAVLSPSGEVLEKLSDESGSLFSEALAAALDLPVAAVAPSLSRKGGKHQTPTHGPSQRPPCSLAATLFSPKSNLKLRYGVIKSGWLWDLEFSSGVLFNPQNGSEVFLRLQGRQTAQFNLVSANAGGSSVLVWSTVDPEQSSPKQVAYILNLARLSVSPLALSKGELLVNAASEKADLWHVALGQWESENASHSRKADGQLKIASAAADLSGRIWARTEKGLSVPFQWEQAIAGTRPLIDNDRNSFGVAPSVSHAVWPIVQSDAVRLYGSAGNLDDLIENSRMIDGFIVWDADNPLLGQGFFSEKQSELLSWNNYSPIKPLGLLVGGTPSQKISFSFTDEEKNRNVGHWIGAYSAGQMLVVAGHYPEGGLVAIDKQTLKVVGWLPFPDALKSQPNIGSLAIRERISVNAGKSEIYFGGMDDSVYVLRLSPSGEISQEAKISHTPKGNPVIVHPSGYYCSPNKDFDGIHFSDGRRTYPLEQFDLRLNRPDFLLESFCAPAEAVAIAKQLRAKRLKRMGITEEMLKPDFHVPELEFVGDTPATTDANEINLSIKASDSKYPLERLKVFVNNVPVNGRDGESLRDQNVQSLERSVPIKLAAGRNKIQVSVLNSAGAESLYANAEVNCTAKRPKSTLYAVAMGVSEYSNPDWNLKYAAKDARDVLARLKDKAGDQYGEVKELLLTDKEVTKESISKIRNFLSGASIDDTVLMFVAGHGLLDSNYDYYFGTADIDFNNPADEGIAFEEFDDLLADLPALKKSLLIDTCHAGELDEDEKTLLASAGGVSAALPTANGVAVRSIGTRGMNVKAIEGARGASEWYDRLQGLFVDLRRGSGSTILSSSAGAEYALESSEQQNGLFTYAVLEALDGKKDADTNKDGSVQMSELGEYVKKRVSELTNNKQTPNTRRVNLEGDFTLAKTR